MPSGRPDSPPWHASDAALIALIAWGALAFGAVYRWAYTPLAAGCFLVGVAGLVAGRRGRPPIAALMVGLALLAVAVGAQLIPLPRPLLLRVSPGTIDFLSQYDFAFAKGGPAHPISIAPEKTELGLALFVALATFMLGATRLLSRSGVQRLGLGILWLGGLLAVFGVIQEVLNLSNLHILVYGFWKPVYEGSRPFGPFINRNHFAGWMLMALPLGLAYVYATIEKMWRHAAPGVHGRIGTLASAAGGQLLLLIFACSMMLMSVLMTRSRSGLAAGALAALSAGSLVTLKQRTVRARLTSAVVFLAIVGATVAWAGGDTILDKLVRPDSNTSTVGGRIPIWRDTLTIIRDFPVTGSGFNTFGRATIFYQTAGRELHFQEAHNDYLQLAAEGGLLLGIPILVTLAVFVRAVRRRFREAPKEGMTYWLRVGAVIGLISIAAQSVVEFSLQMPGNAAMFAVMAAIALHQSPNLRSRPASS